MSQPSQPQYGRQSQPQYGYDGGYPQQGPPPQQGPGRYYTPGPNGVPPGKMQSSEDSSLYLQSQTPAPQSHSIHLKTGHNHFHTPAKHHHPTSSKHNIQLTMLATEYHPVIRVRHRQMPIPTVHSQLTIIRKNSPHLPTQVPPIISPNHTHTIASIPSPRANTHPPSTLLQTASRMGKGSNLKHRTAANKLLIPTRPWALPLHKTITRRTTKHHLHNRHLKRHLLAWVQTHIQSSTRDHLQVGIRRITLRRRNSRRDMLLRRKGILTISIDNG